MHPFDKKAYDRWDTTTSGGQSRLSHLELHEEQLSTLRSIIKPWHTVCDLGCGTNLYKEHFPNIIGVDVIEHPNVDVQSSILDYEPDEQFDIVMALGSIQYYDKKYMSDCFRKMVDLTKVGGTIIFRSLYSEEMKSYEHLLFWNLNLIEWYTKEYNLQHIQSIQIYPLKEKVSKKFPEGFTDHLKNVSIVWKKLEE